MRQNTAFFTSVFFSTILFMILHAPAAAALPGPLSFYIGASIGDSVDLSADDLDISLDDFGVDSDDQSLKLFVGVSLGRIFGVEAALHDFGSIECCNDLVDAGFAADVDGLSVAAVAGFPLWRLHLFAKLGIISWEVDGVLDSFAGGESFSLEGEDAMGGVGVSVKITDHIFARAEIEVFEVADGSLDMASVGVQFKF